jgi:tetratricopeptide (TPR) repeat protein
MTCETLLHCRIIDKLGGMGVVYKALTTRCYDIATGELRKATEGYKQWKQIYPRDTNVYTNLADEFMIAGKYQEAVDAERTNIEAASSVVDYENIAASYIGLNRLDEAKSNTRMCIDLRLQKAGCNAGLSS